MSEPVAVPDPITMTRTERALIAAAQREAAALLRAAVDAICTDRGLNADAVQIDLARGLLLVPPLFSTTEEKTP